MLKFYELSPSPNNTKVRMALRYKDIEFEAISVDPSARSTMIEVSGQELTPVIEDRGVVINDSEDICNARWIRLSGRYWPLAAVSGLSRAWFSCGVAFAERLG